MKDDKVMSQQGRKVKILHVLEAMGGGTKKALYLLVTNMDRNKFDITLALPSPAPYDPLRPLADPRFPERMRSKGYKVKMVDMVGGKVAPIANFRALLSLYWITRKNRYDIVHTHSAIAGFVGRLAAKLARVPVIIYTPEGLSFNDYVSPPRRWLYILLERFAGYFTDAIISCSETEKQQAIEAGIIKSRRISVIENCLDTDKYNADKVDILKKKEELILRLTDPVVGMVARLTPQKGPHYFIKAAAQVLKAEPKTQFVLVGDGELREKVQNLIGQLGISHSLHLLGNRDDYLEIMATFDVFVLSSLWEGMPYAPLEAMLLRKPIIATDITGSRDIIQNDNLGVIVPPKNTVALSKAILELVRNKEQAQQIGRQGEKSIRQRFGINSSVTRVTQLYQELLANKGNHR